MNAIKTLWNAFGNLAASLNGLADTVRSADGRLRQQLALDGPQDAPAAPTAEVIDNAPAATPAAPPVARPRQGRKAAV